MPSTIGRRLTVSVVLRTEHIAMEFVPCLFMMMVSAVRGDSMGRQRRTGMLRVDYRTATEDDLPALTDVMTRAFDDDARRHLGVEKGGPPGYDNGDFFRTWLFADLPTEGYVILRDGIPVGGIIVWVLEDDQFRLGCLFVDPAAQRLGIGMDAWRFLRETYPNARSWVLDTPTWSTSNHRFYERCNFRLAGQDDDSVIYRQVLRPAMGG